MIWPFYNLLIGKDNCSICSAIILLFLLWTFQNKTALRIYSLVYGAMGIYIIYTRQGCSLTSLSQAQHCSRHVNTIKLSHNNNCLSGMCVGGQDFSPQTQTYPFKYSTALKNDFSFTTRACKKDEFICIL